MKIITLPNNDHCNVNEAFHYTKKKGKKNNSSHLLIDVVESRHYLVTIHPQFFISHQPLHERKKHKEELFLLSHKKVFSYHCPQKKKQYSNARKLILCLINKKQKPLFFFEKKKSFYQQSHSHLIVCAFSIDEEGRSPKREKKSKKSRGRNS